MGRNKRDRGFPVPVQTPEAETLLDEVRGILGRRNDAVDRLTEKGADTKIRSCIGEYGVRRWVPKNFKGPKEVAVLRRGTRGEQILDVAFELPGNAAMVIEAQYNRAKLIRTARKVF